MYNNLTLNVSEQKMRLKYEHTRPGSTAHGVVMSVTMVIAHYWRRHYWHLKHLYLINKGRFHHMIYFHSCFFSSKLNMK